MYKKNSILDRPLRPPSARNVENGPIEFQRELERDAAKLVKYKKHDEMKGYSSRNQWEDPQVRTLALSPPFPPQRKNPSGPVFQVRLMMMQLGAIVSVYT